MRVEIQPPPIKSIIAPSDADGAEGAAAPRESGTCIPPPPRCARSVRNLSAVNVVGLPANHPRQSSAPATLTVTPTSATAPKSVVAHHSRHISEPCRSHHPANLAARIRSGGTLAPKSAVAAHPVAACHQQGSSAGHADAGQCSNGRQQIAVGAASASIEPAKSADNDVLYLAGAHAGNGSAMPLNVSNVNVNYYRAVPVNVVSAVPTIPCLSMSAAKAPNGAAPDASNVSNVNIVQAMPLSLGINPHHPMTITTCTEVIVHSSPMSTSPAVILSTTAPSKVVRTFTSTEAQTDSAPIPPPEPTVAARRQRRTERRHVRRSHVPLQPPAAATGEPYRSSSPPPYNPTALFPHAHGREAGHLHQPGLAHIPAQPPPLLHSGNILVAPGTILQSLVPNNFVANGLMTNDVVPFHPSGTGQVPMVQPGPAIPVASTSGYRFPLTANGFRRNRYSDNTPKRCCGLLTWRPVSLRWFISLIALLAVCCVLVGTALGAMKPSGRDHFTVSLLMIGVGIILVTVSGVAWRLTSHNSSTFRSMLGLGSTESLEACPRRFVPHLPPSYGRPHHPYAAMMYPEFQYRPPPPSYQASMQEYRLRLLLLDRGSTPQIQNNLQNAISPPPTYRSHSGSLIRVSLSNRRDATQSEYSCPPSYRSQNSSSRAAAMLQNSSIMHSREQSLSFSESNQDASVVNVNILSANEDIALDNITLDSLKLEPEEINPLKLLLKSTSSELEGMKDGNLVTIVQTSDQSPVIVTVSGSTHSDNCNTVQITESSSEMEILAHL